MSLEKENMTRTQPSIIILNHTTHLRKFVKPLVTWLGIKTHMPHVGFVISFYSSSVALQCS